MKKILFLLLVTFFVSGVSQAFAYEYDYGVSVGDDVLWDGSGVGSGGEFGFSVVGSANSNWSTFCAETDQALATSGTSMEVTGISNYNTSYMNGSSTGGTGMTDTVAWLYWSFTEGDLYPSHNNPNNSNYRKKQQDLQYLIWSELGLPLPNNSYTYHDANRVSGWLSSATLATTTGGWNNDDLVKVQILQLGGYQDVLIVGTANPVPEPTTMALLGIGLIGLVAVGRKKAKQQ